MAVVLLFFLLVALALRIFLTLVSIDFVMPDVKMFYYFSLQDFLLFLVIVLALWALLAKMTRKKPHTLLPLVVLGTSILPLPVIIDMMLTGGETYWSFYLLSTTQQLWLQYISVFGHLPPAIVYVGTRIVLILASLLSGLYVYYVRKSVVRGLLAVVFVYSIFFFFSAFPSFLTYFYEGVFYGAHPSSITIADIASLTLTPHTIFGTMLGLRVALMIKMSMFYVLISSLVVVILMVQESGTTFLAKRLRALWQKRIVLLPVLFGMVLFGAIALRGDQIVGHPFFNAVTAVLVLFFLFLFLVLWGMSTKSKSVRSATMLFVFASVIAMSLVSYKIVFLFVCAHLFVWILITLVRRYQTLIVGMISVLLSALALYVLFDGEHSTVGFPWLVALYALWGVLFVWCGRRITSSLLFASLAGGTVLAGVALRVVPNGFVSILALLALVPFFFPDIVSSARRHARLAVLWQSLFYGVLMLYTVYVVFFVL